MDELEDEAHHNLHVPRLLRPAVSALATFGVRSGDTDETRTRKAIGAVAGFMTCLVLIAIFGPLYIYFDEAGVGLVYIGYGLFVLACLLHYGLTHGNLRRTMLLIAISALPAHLLTSLLLGGFSRSHGVILWGLFFPVLGSLIFFDARSARVWLPLFALNVVLSVGLEPWLRPANNVPPLVGRILLSLNVLTTSLFSMGMMIYFVVQRDQALGLLRAEQQKSENLLLNILPAEIADILKNEQRTIADHFDGASILFADVANFTPLSASMTPAELVEMLNEVFSQLDILVDRYGLEKIKTIGDSYMVAAGVPQPRSDHAQALTHMGLELIALIATHEFRGRRLSMRIGINSGPVVAGVIGRRKFIYDLWGDAVNTASRMESHGKANAIQISRSTYELIKDDFVCVPQGGIQVKGKGEMEVWHVLEAKCLPPPALGRA